MTTLDDGLHDLSFAAYHALPAWGSSSLRAMRVGPPARVLWEREHPREDTDATILGTRAHCLILTPILFESQYVELPADAPQRPTEAMLTAAKPSPSSVERQAWWRDFETRRAGREPIKAAEIEVLRNIQDAFDQKEVARNAIIDATAIEKSMVWTCEATGVRLKGRPDFYDDEYVFDLKVTREASRLSFAAYRNGWVHQLAHYRTGLRSLGVLIKTGRIVAVDTEPPHYVYCVEFRESDLDVLAMENEQTVLAMQRCEAAGEWPDTPDKFERIEIPQYAIDEQTHALDLTGATEVE